MTVLIKRLILPVLCLFVLTASCYVDGFEEDGLLTKEDEIDIENQLKLLNKPAIKTVETKHGDLYDCVDFYKQPAFDHPLLKNHTFHHKMRPLVPAGTSKKPNAKSKIQELKLTRVGCPDGTVPIRRVTKDDLVRAKLNEKKFGSKYHQQDSSTLSGHFHYAVMKAGTGQYSGGSASIGIYNVAINNYNQYSTSRMSIASGSDALVVGSMTSPFLYNTSDTHLFIYTLTSRAACFNIQCPGFVLINKDVPVDMRIDPVSRRGAQAVALKFNVYRANDGNWWFELTGSGTKVGFWPSNILEGGLQSGIATGIDWGGEAFSPVGVPSPPMGSGILPLEDTLQDAFCHSVKVRNLAQQEVEIDNTSIFADNTAYNAIDETWVDSEFGHLMFFGGPGGALI